MIFVFISYNYTPGFDTVESWLKRTTAYIGLQEALAKADRVISIKQIDYTGCGVYGGVEHHFVNLHREKTFFPHKIHAYVKKLNPDVVVIHGTHFPLQVMQLRLLLNSRIKIIIQHHAEQPFKGLKKYAQRLADRYVDAYLFASTNMGLDWVKRGNLASAKKIHEVMEISSVFEPISRACAHSKTGITQQRQAFLWVGRLNANKDPLNVVKAFLQYAAINSEAQLYMIYQNDDLLGEVKELIKQHPATSKSIILIGQIQHHDLIYWFNSVDFIISGSHYEGSGAAVCEAMSCGCIPIVTAIDSFKMITDNGKCGLLYQPGNEAELLNLLLSTQNINIPETRKRIFKYYQATLSFKAIARRFREIGTMLLS
jgi:glycosyltransferase involved in cell wall biosynthesis